MAPDDSSGDGTVTARRHRFAREYLFDGDGMYLPGWLADHLERQFAVSAHRMRVRGADPTVDEALLAFAHIVSAWRAAGSDQGSVDGTSLPETPEPAPRSTGDALLVAEAAGLVGISDRAVRRAICENRLPAQRIGRRWLVDRADAMTYREQRKSA